VGSTISSVFTTEYQELVSIVKQCEGALNHNNSLQTPCTYN